MNNIKELTKEEIKEIYNMYAKEYLRNWRKNNPDKVKVYNSRCKEYAKKWRKKQKEKNK